GQPSRITMGRGPRGEGTADSRDGGGERHGCAAARGYWCGGQPVAGLEDLLALARRFGWTAAQLRLVRIGEPGLGRGALSGAAPVRGRPWGFDRLFGGGDLSGRDPPGGPRQAGRFAAE